MRLGLGLGIPGTGGVVQAAFSPLDLSPVLWLDASDTSTITEVGGSVSQWDDLSGNGNNVTQGTSANQPATGTRTINSLNVLDFNGSSDRMQSAASVSEFNTSKAFTCFVVHQTDTTSSGTQGLVVAVRGSKDYTNGFVVDRHNTNLRGTLGIGSDSGTAADYIFKTLSNSSTSALLLRIEASAGSSTLTAHVDGVLQTFSGGGGSMSISDFLSTGSGDHSFVVGSRYFFGGFSGFFDGGMAEIIVTDGILTAGEISDTEAYLAAKWGITI